MKIGPRPAGARRGSVGADAIDSGTDIAGPPGSKVVTGLQGTPVCVTAPVLGEALVFDGTEWCPGSVAVPVTLDDLTDVTITSPSDMQGLIYDATAGQWVNTSAIWRPLMDGTGAVITDGVTGEAIMALN